MKPYKNIIKRAKAGPGPVAVAPVEKPKIKYTPVSQAINDRVSMIRNIIGKVDD